jgi:hypothetical protein
MIDTSMHMDVDEAITWALDAMQSHEDSNLYSVHRHLVQPVNPRYINSGESYPHACIECKFSLSIFNDETDTMLFIRRPA